MRFPNTVCPAKKMYFNIKQLLHPDFPESIHVNRGLFNILAKYAILVSITALIWRL